MKKTFLVMLAFLIIPVFLHAGFIKGNQFDTAKKWADRDEIPVVFFDPGTGDAQGYVLFADIDGIEGKEIIIPYRVKIPEKKVEDTADIYRQTISVDVVKGDKKFRGFFEIGLTYVHTPKVYMTVRDVFTNELPKVFLMVHDGVKKKDKKLTLMYNSYDKKDRGREVRVFETDKMPWELITWQFDRTKPTITEFDVNWEEAYGKFYIRALDNPREILRVPEEEMKRFEEALKATRNDIFFELDE
ncbi:MAG: hypothetical protein LLG37_03175 [Spirochaetia bacterium]|nr:hypothetical protein [Spirochaetia bacterium]